MKGLTTKQAEKRLSAYGPNLIGAGTSFSSVSLLIAQYKNVLSGILLFASFFAFMIGESIDAFFIVLVLLINGLFGFFQEYRAEKTLEKLKELVVDEISVLRDGVEVLLSVSKIVPGDIVLIREGDKIPADGELISKTSLEVDDSVFTGESMPVEKKKGTLLSAGTFVVRGKGMLLVGATGEQTRLGQIAQEMRGLQKPQTPLANNLSVLGKKLAISAIVVMLLMLPIGILQGRDARELILTAISLSVAIIPEGLPLVVTVALAMGAYRLMKKNTIVRKMTSIETLGATTVILSDKTGTLTQNNMQVKEFWVEKSELLPHLLRACVVGNTASLEQKKRKKKPDVLGDKTDGALLLFAQEQVKDLGSFRQEGKTLSETPFDSKTKRIETEWEDRDGNIHTYYRGAPESIFRLMPQKQEIWEKEVANFAREGLRVIGFAHHREGEKHPTFLGLVAIYDAPREEAKTAIQKANRAGIKVVMVTGDNPVTAQAIAREIGLFKEGDLIVSSLELQEWSDAKLLDLLPRVKVFARLKPEDKLRLVRVYKQARYVVAVTGDGVNDALALSESNIGVAMGETGTDVAKESADIIITDDNLATIVKAVEEGRNIFQNISRVVVYLVASNIAELVAVFGGIVLGLPLLLAAPQILWINLVSDGFPALALATDPGDGRYLLQKPRDVEEHILNKERIVKILKISLPLAFGSILLFAFLIRVIPESTARLVVFNMFVVAEMIIVFIVRGGIFPINRALFISILLSLFLQLLLMLHPLTRGIFS